MSTGNRNARYLYAMVPGGTTHELGEIGIDGEKVFTISDGAVAAVVSEFTGTRIRPERKYIGAHQGVLKALLATVTPLPMSFGVIADSSNGIADILTRNRAAIASQLQRVEGKVEMGLRVTWDVPNIFEYFIENYPDLRAARDHFFGKHGQPSQDDKIELGRLFDRALHDAREAHAAKVEEILAPACVEIKRNNVRGECDVMNLACLVKKQESKTTFETSIFEAARLFDNNFSFDFNGPWAPHNFVDLELSKL